jgi:O-antigen/teichoic acid export membrane protein
MCLFGKRAALVFSNTLAQLIGKGVTAAITFASLALIARRFGPAGVGEYSLVLTYIGLFYLLADGGLNAVVVREVVENPPFFDLKVRNLLGLRLVWALTLTFAALAIMAFLPYSAVFKLGVVVMAAAIPLQGVLVSLNASFQSKLSYFRSSAAVILGGLAAFVLTLAVVFLGLSLWWLFPALLIGLATSVIVAVFFAGGLGLKPIPLFDLDQSRRLVLATLPLGAALVLNMVAFKIDVFLLAYFSSLAEVGRYNLAYKVFENVITLPIFVVNSLYPLFVLDRTKGSGFLKESARKTAWVFLGSSVFLAVGLFGLAPWIISILGGRGFSHSVVILRLLAAWLPLFFLSALVMWLLITLHLQRRLVWIYLAALLANVFLNVWLIPRFGALAAAANTGVTEALILLLGLTALRGSDWGRKAVAETVGSDKL